MKINNNIIICTNVYSSLVNQKPSELVCIVFVGLSLYIRLQFLCYQIAGFPHILIIKRTRPEASFNQSLNNHMYIAKAKNWLASTYLDYLISENRYRKIVFSVQHRGLHVLT